jgi:hypothetical protein
MFPSGQEIFSFLNTPDYFGGPSSCLFTGQWVLFLREYSGQGVRLTTYHHVVQKSRMRGAIMPLHHRPSWQQWHHYLFSSMNIHEIRICAKEIRLNQITQSVNLFYESNEPFEKILQNCLHCGLLDYDTAQSGRMVPTFQMILKGRQQYLELHMLLPDCTLHPIRF